MAKVQDIKSKQKKTKSDGWGNVVTGLGTSRDKRLGGFLEPTPFNTNFREFEDIYHGDDLAATIAELPAKEMIREWIVMATDSTATDDSPNEKRDLEDSVTISKKMMNYLEERNTQTAFFEGLLWGRVFGGSVMFMGFDDGSEDLSEPLNEDNLRSLSHFTVFDRWDVNIASFDTDPASPNFGEPVLYRIDPTAVTGQAALEQNLVHASRVIRFPGAMTSRRRRKHNSGWDDSIYARLRDLIRDYNLAWGGVSHLLQDFAQGVYKIKDLAVMLSEDNGSAVIQRLMQMDKCRSLVRAIPVDAELESFERTATPVGGLSDLLDRFAIRYSAGARMPATLLFGQSPGGMNSTGESDITFFYDQIKASQESTLRPMLQRLLELVFKTKDGPTGGVVPELWSFEFAPLFQLDEKEEADLRKTQAETDEIYMNLGVVDPAEVTNSRFGGDKYSTETVIDQEARDQDNLAAERIEPVIVQEDSSHLGSTKSSESETPAVCDPSSSSYDPVECSKIRAKKKK